eukprot:GILK01008983.1.p1 GENE.GILK01008983.1~~GILK01008983.1.p1  ORF type:complete len:198 (+),score=20.74 GILK01008983.1:37-630(+)
MQQHTKKKFEWFFEPSPKKNTFLTDYIAHGPTTSDHDEKRGHWKDYWKHRLEKLEGQKPDSDLYQHMLQKENVYHNNGVSTESKTPPIFDGLSIYFNGRTGKYSSYHLSKMVQLHGGRVNPCLSKRGVSHVVCTNLSASKSEKVLKHVGTRWEQFIITPDWIVDSIKSKRRLPEHDYLVLKDPQSRKLDHFIAHDLT